MADDKRNPGNQPQGGNQPPDRQRGGKDRSPDNLESPGSGRARRDDEDEQQE
jgi:hypothetical protein